MWIYLTSSAWNIICHKSSHHYRLWKMYILVMSHSTLLTEHIHPYETFGIVHKSHKMFNRKLHHLHSLRIMGRRKVQYALSSFYLHFQCYRNIYINLKRQRYHVCACFWIQCREIILKMNWRTTILESHVQVRFL